jgi:hypothetical protein
VPIGEAEGFAEGAALAATIGAEDGAALGVAAGAAVMIGSGVTGDVDGVAVAGVVGPGTEVTLPSGHWLLQHPH